MNNLSQILRLCADESNPLFAGPDVLLHAAEVIEKCEALVKSLQEDT